MLITDGAKYVADEAGAYWLLDEEIALYFANSGSGASRPHVSDDNPYSEAQFKTLKYRPDFPDRFGSIEDARAHCRHFFHWYNHEHRHGGIGLMAPAAVHDGTAAALTEQRAITLDAAFAAHPSASRASPQSRPHCPPSNNDALWSPPVVFLMTDGGPTDQWQQAAELVKEGEASKGFAFFGIGVENANMGILSKISSGISANRVGNFRDS